MTTQESAEFEILVWYGTDEKVAEVGQAAPGACTDIDENTMYSSRAGEQIYLSLYLLSDQSVGGSVCLCSYQPG